MSYASRLFVMSGSLLAGGLIVLWMAAEPSLEYGFDYVGIDWDLPLAVALLNGLVVGAIAGLICRWVRSWMSALVLLVGSFPTFFMCAIISGAKWSDDDPSFDIGSSVAGFALWALYCATCWAASVLVVRLRKLDSEPPPPLAGVDREAERTAGNGS